MAQTSRRTRVLNTLLPHSLTPLQRDIANRLDEIDAHREKAKQRCAEVCAAAVEYQKAVGPSGGAAAGAARDLSGRVIAEVEKAHTYFSLDLSRNRNRITDLELGWRTGRRGAAADLHSALRTDRDRGERALTGFLTLLDQKEGLVRPAPAREKGDPLVPPGASAPGARAADASAPLPRTELHDRSGRAPRAAADRTAVRPAARRRGPTERRGRGTGA
ncbi:hypothetical protein ABZ234_04345 [Nocardiopsis sp. NPDC006198]|uniref:hypothetical protein n=1 Tax=Nocardiopsis sp. NPDC006198 TaxID=3154472 RepID=UPI0033B3BFC5